MKNLKEFTQVLLLATVKPKTCQFDTDKRLLLLYRKIVNLVLKKSLLNRLQRIFKGFLL